MAVGSLSTLSSVQEALTQLQQCHGEQDPTTTSDVHVQPEADMLVVRWAQVLLQD